LAALTSTRRAKAAAVAAAAYPLVAALGRTLDWRVEGASHYDELVRSGRPPILALWHGRILPATLYSPVRPRCDLAAGQVAAFTVDGPRGPARVAQPGAVWLAGATGHPVLPFHIEAARSWSAGSWDRTLVPKPFSTVAIAIGEPFTVPSTDDELVRESCRDLERRLELLEKRCAALLKP
jgi:lysophospholipid acyltransferase (LPLAT)-like uncharacterized protein